jgi:hypothetical protein
MKLLRVVFLFFAAVAALFMSRVAEMSDKLQFVEVRPGEPAADLNDKLKFVGHNIGHRIGGHSGAEIKAERDARMACGRSTLRLFIRGLMPCPRRVQRTPTRIGE